jgi:hypothetical protein
MALLGELDATSLHIVQREVEMRLAGASAGGRL